VSSSRFSFSLLVLQFAFRHCSIENYYLYNELKEEEVWQGINTIVPQKGPQPGAGRH
jgi:hypothetical protein